MTMPCNADNAQNGKLKNFIQEELWKIFKKYTQATFAEKSQMKTIYSF